MNKKGFTLIELLAVIVILAIIAVIAIPRILNVVDEAKKGAAEASALGYIDAVEKQIMINATSKKYDEIIDDTYPVPLNPKYGVTVKGKAPNSGEIVIENGKVKTYSVTVDEYTISYDGTTKSVTKTGGSSEPVATCTEYEVNDIVFSKDSKGYQEFEPKCNGRYKVELWGAQGGGSNGGKGAYTSGTIEFTTDMKLYVYVGNQPVRSENAFNGGGQAQNTWYPSDDGGGATDIRYFGENYTPSNDELAWDSTIGLNSRIMVAAAGGGEGAGSVGGNAGGLTGYKANTGGDSTTYAALGGTQTSGGKKDTASYPGYDGSFGHGGNGEGYNTTRYGGGAGGSGYYGGGGGGNYGSVHSGAGGSSYISGHTGCVAITSSSNRAAKSGCSEGTTNNNCSIHYSNLSFTDTIMIDGSGYSWTNVKAATATGMPAHTGLTTITGNPGHGYAKITYLGN